MLLAPAEKSTELQPDVLALKPPNALKGPTDAEERQLKRKILAHVPLNINHVRYLRRYRESTQPGVGRPPGYKPSDYYRKKMVELAEEKEKREAVKKQYSQCMAEMVVRRARIEAARRARVETLIHARQQVRMRGGLKLLSNGQIIV
ncbi:hypothetical protein B0H10DRAFT_2224848 [Mycena sp. CBHHK59/15]|nr:hypothetical protein B0H10DRAFT_2224848 [Mycena sp. CBHHK59/15]